MNPRTGEIIMVKDGEPMPDGFVAVPKHVAEAQLIGKRVLASRSLRRLRKIARQNRKAGRSR